MVDSNKEYTFEEIAAMLPAETEKICIIDKFLSALQFIKTTEEFKTVDMQRYLKCGYGDTRRILDTLMLLGVIEEVTENMPSGIYRVKCMPVNNMMNGDNNERS